MKKQYFFYFNLEFQEKGFLNLFVKKILDTNISLEKQFFYFINYINNENKKENQSKIHLDLIYYKLHYIFLRITNNFYEKKLFDLLLNQYIKDEEKITIINTIISNWLKNNSNKVALEQFLDILKIIKTYFMIYKIIENYDEKQIKKIIIEKNNFQKQIIMLTTKINLIALTSNKKEEIILKCYNILAKILKVSEFENIIIFQNQTQKSLLINKYQNINQSTLNNFITIETFED